MEKIVKKPIFIVLLALFVFYILNMSVSSEIVQEKLNDKNVLIELFINAECTICPKAAFCLEGLAWSYESGKVILVEEHIWGDGYDSPETNERYNWYVEDGVKGTPDIFLTVCLSVFRDYVVIVMILRSIIYITRALLKRNWPKHHLLT
jgi:hypothetical protein